MIIELTWDLLDGLRSSDHVPCLNGKEFWTLMSGFSIYGKYGCKRNPRRDMLRSKLVILKLKTKIAMLLFS